VRKIGRCDDDDGLCDSWMPQGEARRVAGEQGKKGGRRGCDKGKKGRSKGRDGGWYM